MSIYNSKISYLALPLIIFSYSLSTASLAVSTPTPLITNVKSSNIQNIIFNAPTVNTVKTIYKDTLNDYLINIFCTETTNRYVKVASGSGVFLSNPDETTGVVITNAHVARHLLDSNKKCVGRTSSPTTTTHTLVLRYIPYYWLSNNNQYIIGDPDQNSTGEFDFAILESKRIKPIKVDTSNIYNVIKQTPKLKISNYGERSALNNTYIYSYPAREILSKNVYNPLFQKKDLVSVSSIYSSPSQNIQDSLLDVTGSRNIDHGSSGGMVVSQGQTNSFIGLSSILIKDNIPQVVRVVTIKHILATLENDLKNINNVQTDPFLVIIRDMLSKREIDMSLIQILKNIKLTSVLENNTRDTLVNLRIIN